MDSNNYLENEITYEEESPTLSDSEELQEDSLNMPINSSPLYPRIYIGESAKPLQGQFNQSEYVDDNISRTWTGLMTSYYG